MDSKEKFARLSDLRGYIQSEVFQTFIMKPLYEELDKQKNAYDCESLKELWRVKGKKDGIKFLIDTLKRVDLEWSNTKLEIESE